jgi:hypothetical protein
MYIKSILLTLLTGLIQYSYAQVSETGRLGNGLVYYIPFDGSTSPSVTLQRISFSEDQSQPTEYPKTNLRYESDRGLLLNNSSRSYVSFLELDASTEMRNVVFWFRISENSNDTVSSFSKFENLRIAISDNLLLKTTSKDGSLSLILEDNKDSSNVQTISIANLKSDVWHMMSIALNRKDKIYQLKLFTANGTNVEEQPLPGLSNFNNYLKELFKDEKTFPAFFITFCAAHHSSMLVNDFRIYDRFLDEVDYRRLSNFTIDNYLEIAKYELAYTYKKAGDEYFIQGNTAAAKLNYNKAAEMFNTNSTKAINKESLEEVNTLYATYYKLLDMDIQYRQSLLYQGYAFWGQDFSTAPLFPVEELASFKQTYKNFKEIYDNIQNSLTNIEKVNEEQMMQNISKLIKTYETNIASAQAVQKDYNIRFYESQDAAINAKLASISFRNKQIEREVENNNKTIDENQSSINSLIASTVTQSLTGVPIDPSKNVGSNLKNLGVELISNNPELRNAILGTNSDIINLTNVSIDYYKKSEKALGAINRMIKGDEITADNIFSLGTTLSNLNVIPKEEWNTLQNRYSQVKSNAQQVKALKADAKKLIAAANFRNNPNLESVSHFMEWAGNTDYFPEGKKYTDIYFQVCENIRRKKYESFYELGSLLVKESEASEELRTNINRLKTIYYQSRPIASVIERIDKDSAGVITEALGNVVLNREFWPQIKDFKIQAFLMTAISKTLALEGNIEIKRKLVNALLTQTPDICLTFIPPNAKEEIKVIYKIRDDNELISKFKRATVKIDSHGGSLTVNLGEKTLFEIDHDSIKVSTKKHSFIYHNIDKQSHDYLTILNTLFSDLTLRKEVMKNVLVSDWYSFLGPGSISNPELIYDRVLSVLKDKQQQDEIVAIKEDGLKAYIGANVSKAYQDDSNIEKPTLFVSPEEFYQVDGRGAGDAATRAMATSALNIAFPGYGTAIDKGLQIVGNILDSYDLIDNLKELYKEQKSLNNELLVQLEKLRANSFDKKIAYYEKEIASLNLELARKQRDEFSKMEFDMIADKQIEKRNKLAFQLPIYFYYAERLRMYYNRLFKASTFWFGSYNTLSEIIEKDQSNIRLALDQSINLYKWVKQPDISSMRQDVDKIENYWRTQYTLITDPETEKKIKYGSTKIFSHTFRMDKTSTPFTNSWKKFTDWKEKVKNGDEVKDFEFEIDMSSYLEETISKYKAEYREPKVVDLSMAAVNTGKGVVNSPGSILEICHSGISFNMDGSITVLMEKKSPVTANEVHKAEDGSLFIKESPKNLQERWEPKIYQSKFFEGYNLDTKWSLFVKPSKSSVTIDNIILQFTYQFRESDRKPKELPATSHIVQIEYYQDSPQTFRTELSPEKKRIIKESLSEAQRANKIKSWKLTEIINKNGSQDVLIN